MNDYETNADLSAPIDLPAQQSQPASLVLQELRPLSQDPGEVYLHRVSAGSRRTVRDGLNILARLLGVPPLLDQDPATGKVYDCGYRRCNWNLLRYQHTQALRSLVAERYAAATANKLLAVLRGVLKEAWRLGYMDVEDYHRAIDLDRVRGTTGLRGRALADDELARLLAVCAADSRLLSIRDAAILTLLYGAGLRRSELVACDRAHYDAAQQALHVRAGKGNKQRLLYLPDAVCAALDRWLRVRGEWAGPLFVRISKGDALTHARLTDQAIYTILESRAKVAGIQQVSPHDFRRTYISVLLDSGVDLATTSDLAGHSDPATTKKYDRRGDRAKRAAVQKFHIPIERED